MKGTARTTRLRKVACPGCGFHFRASRAQVRRVGLGPCWGCGERMTCPDLDDLATIAPDDPELVAAFHAADDYARRSVEQQNRQGARGRGASAGLSLPEREALAAERASVVVRARRLEELSAPGLDLSDEMPF